MRILVPATIVRLHSTYPQNCHKHKRWQRLNVSSLVTPCVTVFEVDEAQMRKLAYKVFDCYNHEWARFVYNNRDEYQDFTHEYDIVFGPIADDYVGLQMRRFRFSKLTFEQFLEEIKYPKGVTFQYAFCTPEAIKLLHRV